MTTTHPGVDIVSPTLSDLDSLVDQWVALASGQRAHDSHLAADANRTPFREELARHIVTGGVRVARSTAERADAEHGSDEDLLGFVMFGLEHGVYEQTVTRGVVHNLYVHPTARDRGVGSALLETAETQLTAAGAERLSLDVMARNERARRFYQRHGYQPHSIELEKPARNDTHSKEDG